MSTNNTTNGENNRNANIEMFKIRKLIKNLQMAKGNGTSMISLVIPPKDQISRITSMLTNEYGTASNIKSRVNRQSVLSAITSTQQKLKLYNKIPPNGLVVYCGTVITEDGKEKLVNIDLEPFKPINTSLYLCDNKFHVECLSELLESDSRFGFIIMDGHGCLFATLQGNTREIIHKIQVDLPKKHGRGGQSSVRFARLREEKRHNYVRKVGELATKFFIANDKPNVTGMVLAGSADFKNVLSQSDLFDPRLSSIVISIADVSYGGENGFNQAIELSSESLKNVKFVAEKKLIQKYFDELAKDTGRYCFGIEDTLKAMDMGAVETLIVYENLEALRYVLKNNLGETKVVYAASDKPEHRKQEDFVDKETNKELDIVEYIPLVEWLTEHYTEYGAQLEFISDKSSEGMQFVKGFSGIGGLLRYKVDFDVFNYDSDDFFSD